jgi:hypothetical protein
MDKSFLTLINGQLTFQVLVFDISYPIKKMHIFSVGGANHTLNKNLKSASDKSGNLGNIQLMLRK